MKCIYNYIPPRSICITGIYRTNEKDENVFNKLNKLNAMMSEEQKLEFYQSEYRSAPLAHFVGFRCTKNLYRFLETKAMLEGRDISQIIRRLLTRASEEEGFDRNAV